MKAKDLSLMLIFAALYAALVYVFAPISFYVFQFRIAGVIRPAIARKWILALGYSIGIALGNLVSPYAGLYELLFMPIVGFVAGSLGYIAARRFGGGYFTAGIVTATVVSAGLSWMFFQLLGIPILFAFVYTFITEQLICFLGACLFVAVSRRVELWPK